MTVASLRAVPAARGPRVRPASSPDLEHVQHRRFLSQGGPVDAVVFASVASILVHVLVAKETDGGHRPPARVVLLASLEGRAAAAADRRRRRQRGEVVTGASVVRDGRRSAYEGIVSPRPRSPPLARPAPAPLDRDGLHEGVDVARRGVRFTDRRMTRSASGL